MSAEEDILVLGKRTDSIYSKQMCRNQCSRNLVFDEETLQIYEVIFSTKVGIVHACIHAVDSV